jgi:hypothetical protein
MWFATFRCRTGSLLATLPRDDNTNDDDDEQQPENE